MNFCICGGDMKHMVKDIRPAIVLMVVWGIYAAVHIALGADESSKASVGYMSAFADDALMIIVGIYVFWLLIHALPAAKKIFALFVLRWVFVALDDIGYNLTYNVFHIPHDKLTAVGLAIFNVPYVIWLCITFIIFATILVTKANAGENKSAVYAPGIVLIISAVLVFFVPIQWKSEPLSITRFYDVADIFFIFANFMIIASCLFVTKSKALAYLSVGYLITTASDVIMNFNFLSQHYGVSGLTETAWILGSLFAIYGFSQFKKTRGYETSPALW